MSVCGVITGRRHVSRYRETQGQKSHTQKPVSREMYKLGKIYTNKSLKCWSKIFINFIYILYLHTYKLGATVAEW